MNSKNKENLNKQIDELVNYVDNFMSKPNAGHLNIKVNEGGQINKEELNVDNTGGCCQSACKSPTLFEGLENNFDEED